MGHGDDLRVDLNMLNELAGSWRATASRIREISLDDTCAIAGPLEGSLTGATAASAEWVGTGAFCSIAKHFEALADTASAAAADYHATDSSVSDAFGKMLPS